MSIRISAFRRVICAGILCAFSMGASSSEPMIYPNNGQDDAQQEKDNYECYSWAKGQSSFDPMAPPTTTQPPPQQQAGQYQAGRDSYNRAFSACMEGRGYSVK